MTLSALLSIMDPEQEVALWSGKETEIMTVREFFKRNEKPQEVIRINKTKLIYIDTEEKENE